MKTTRIVQQEYTFPLHVAPGGKARLTLSIYADESKLTDELAPVRAIAEFDRMRLKIAQALVHAVDAIPSHTHQPGNADGQIEPR